MTDGFQATLSDLRAAARAFSDRGGAFRTSMPANGPAPVNGGDWVINDALSVALESVGLLHTQLAGVISDDAANLEATCREYQYAEDENTRLASGVTADPAKMRK